MSLINGKTNNDEEKKNDHTCKNDVRREQFFLFIVHGLPNANSATGRSSLASIDGGFLPSSSRYDVYNRQELAAFSNGVVTSK